MAARPAVLPLGWHERTPSLWERADGSASVTEYAPDLYEWGTLGDQGEAPDLRAAIVAAETAASAARKPAEASACPGHHGPGLAGSCALCGEARDAR